MLIVRENFILWIIMPDLTNFSLDPLSFWVGVVAATLLWWLIGRLKSYLPGLKNYLQKIYVYIQKRRAEGVAYHIKLAALRRSQTEHLAKCLFSLDDILIPPRLILPPTSGDPHEISEEIPVANQVLPYTPDFPEIIINFGGATISLAQAISKGANLVVIGSPGSGKTVALANLAAQIARGQIETADNNKSLNHTLPIFLHVLDLDFFQWNENSDPLEILSNALRLELPVSVKRQLGSVLQSTIEKGEVILLLDGFDELSVQQSDQYSDFLKRILVRYPTVQIVVTASPDHLDGLLSLGLYPVAISAWSIKDCRDFLYKWRNIWERKIISDVRGDSTAAYDGALLTGWLETENKIFSPLEWTLVVWGAFNGGLEGFGIHNALDSYIQWASRPFISRLTLEGLAFELFTKKICSQTYHDMDRFFSKFNPKNFLEKNTESNLQSQRNLNIRAETSFSQRTLNPLLERGLLREHSTGLIRFSNPLIAGYLASYSIENASPFSIAYSYWSIETSALQFLASRHTSSNWIDAAIQENYNPLYRRLLQAGRALRYSAQTQSWHGEFLKRTLMLIHDDRVLMPVKMRLLALLAFSNNLSLPGLFRQLLNSPKREVRFLSILGLGVLGEIRSTNDIAKLISDPDSGIRSAACLALSLSTHSQITQLKQDILHQGDEVQRRIIAESFALLPPDGPEILVNALSSQDILTRRAAVAGLSRIREEWVIKLLEKTAIEDGQWVVKNAALQAAERLKDISRFAPLPYIPAAESSWLISFASRHGLGIPAGDPAMDMLLFALNDGTLEEKTAAAEYLQGFPNREVVQELLKSYQTTSDEKLQEKSYLALSYLLSSNIAGINQTG